MSREFNLTDRIESTDSTIYYAIDSGIQGTLRSLIVYAEDETAEFKLNIYCRDIRGSGSDEDPMLNKEVYRVLPEQTVAGGTALALFEKWYSYQTHFEKNSARTGIRGFLWMELEKTAGVSSQVIDISCTLLRA